jgi:TolA-binding protein
MRQYREAIPRFKETIKSKSSDKVDDALLLIAECHRQLGETEEAKKYYTQLLNQHPRSEHIIEARKRLQML